MTDPFAGRDSISADEYRRWLAEQEPIAAGRLVPAPPPDWHTSEKAFQQKVSDFAREHGWMGYHTWSSVHSAPGFPDLFLLRHPRIEIAELKVGRNKPTKAQLRWLDAFRALDLDAAVFGVRLWYPEDIEEIERILA